MAEMLQEHKPSSLLLIIQVTMNISYLLITKQCNKHFLMLFWLFLAYNFTGGFTTSVNKNIMCIDLERKALLQFKHNIQVDNCGLLSSWSDHNKNCCEWHGIHCNNHNGRVVKLDLGGIENRCLKGSISSSLVQLHHLSYLNLSLNDFTNQPIPSFIGSLMNLKHLDLSDTGFVGEIPHQLGNLSGLTYLNLGSNIYIHQFPNLYAKSVTWLAHLTLLRYINLNGVNLSKAKNLANIVNSLPLLRALHLKECYLPRTLYWPLPTGNSSNKLSILNLSYNDLNSSSIFQWLFNLRGINTSLKHIDLSYNRLDGSFPSALRNLHALSFLDLSSNFLGGNLPSSFDGMQSLSYLDLSSNNFSGLPKTLGNLCNLQELYLFENNLTDELARIIQMFNGCASKSLLLLHLSGNKIWGSVPDIISIFSSLTKLAISNNQLNGTISQSLGKLLTLEVLDISNNHLKGTLSHIHFINLANLYSLDLSNNPSLVVNIDADWVPPFQLDHISLRSCLLGPKFPKWLVNQTHYSYLDISCAGISDRLPKFIWNPLPSNLYYLNISYNNISGTLTEFSSKQLPARKKLDVDMSFNNLEGSIPSFPWYVTSLKLNNNKFCNPYPFLCPQRKISLFNLDLSNNLLSGKLPDCWMNLDQLSILHLENNNFSGAIPASIGYMNQLQVVHLCNNKFLGELPRSLENLTSLVILGLGHNSISGHIPATIGYNLKNLGFFSIRSNNFVGEIPLSLCHLSHLQILDLSINHITGVIPNCIHNLTSMINETNLMPQLRYDIRHDSTGRAYIWSTYTDVATVTWKRKEWKFRNSLGRVKQIDVSNNHLEGEIPTEISSLTGLVSLDLSSNNLTGSLSPKIGLLTALQYLDMSNNHLSGEIPTSFIELNFLGILDLSHNHLSGQIPTGTLLQSFDSSAYIGNSELCGLPLTECPRDKSISINTEQEDTINQQDENESDGIFPGLYVSVILGFIIGFWGVCGSLVIKTTWRGTFFGYIDAIRDKIYVIIRVTLARVQRKM